MGLPSLLDFRYRGRPVRVEVRNGEPWWVAKDVCDALELDQVSRALDRLDPDERGLLEVPHPQAPGQTLMVNAVNEPGLYALVMASRKPEAKEFKRWINHEVLPSIRRTGSYSVQPAPPPPPMPTTPQMFLQMAQMMVDLDERQKALERQQNLLAADHEAIRDEVATWRQVREEAEAEAAELPAAEGDVPDLNPRAALNRLVRAYCVENGIGHQVAWNRLYMEYRDRFHVDLKARAKGRKTPLDVAEDLRAIKNLYALGMHLFGGKRKGVAS